MYYNYLSVINNTMKTKGERDKTNGKRGRGFMITIHIKLVFRVQGIYTLRKICIVKFWDCN